MWDETCGDRIVVLKCAGNLVQLHFETGAMLFGCVQSCNPKILKWWFHKSRAKLMCNQFVMSSRFSAERNGAQNACDDEWLKVKINRSGLHKCFEKGNCWRRIWGLRKLVKSHGTEVWGVRVILLWGSFEGVLSSEMCMTVALYIWLWWDVWGGLHKCLECKAFCLSFWELNSGYSKSEYPAELKSIGGFWISLSFRGELWSLVWRLVWTLLMCALLRCAILKCAFSSCAILKCAFSNCAILKCAFSSCAILKCAFSSCAILKCAFSNCAILKCAFSNCAILKCAFSNCAILKCACSNCAILKCAFSSCAILKCAVSNCAILKCAFSGCFVMLDMWDFVHGFCIVIWLLQMIWSLVYVYRACWYNVWCFLPCCCYVTCRSICECTNAVVNVLSLRSEKFMCWGKILRLIQPFCCWNVWIWFVEKKMLRVKMRNFCKFFRVGNPSLRSFLKVCAWSFVYR